MQKIDNTFLFENTMNIRKNKYINIENPLNIDRESVRAHLPADNQITKRK